MTSLSLSLQHLPSARLSVVARRPRFALLIDLPVPACAAVDESSSAGGGGRRAAEETAPSAFVTTDDDDDGGLGNVGRGDAGC